MENTEKFQPHRHLVAGGEGTDPDDEPHTPPSPADQQEQVKRLRELFHGRFSEDGVAELLQYLNWNMMKATRSLLSCGPEKDVKEEDAQLKAILERLKNCKPIGLDDIKQLAMRGKIETENRLFACGDCDHSWWKRVPARKQVSKCNSCRVKYDPIPKEYEWGWAIFHCACGNTFSGFGQMNKTESTCFNCRATVTPSEIKPPEKRGPSRSRNQHQCNAPDCHHRQGRGADNMSNQHQQKRAGRGGHVLTTTAAVFQPTRHPRHNHLTDGNIGALGGGRHEQITQGVWNLQCAHPRSRRNHTVLMASIPHVSTGSTVDTFLPQTDGSNEPVFTPSLHAISEEDEDDEDGRRSSGED